MADITNLPEMPAPAKLRVEGLIGQLIRNEKRIEKLFDDIADDVSSLTRNADNIEEWLNNVGEYASANPLITGRKAGDMHIFVDSINKVIDDYSFLPMGGTQELVKGMITENTMHYVTKLGEDVKNEMRRLAFNAYRNRVPPAELAKTLARRIRGLGNTRAKAIARTETMRAANLANWAQARYEGARSFTIIHFMDYCGKCEELYKDGTEVFDINEVENLPPVHPNCRCVPRFSMKPATTTPADKDALKYMDRMMDYGYDFHDVFEVDKGYGNTVMFESYKKDFFTLEIPQMDVYNNPGMGHPTVSTMLRYLDNIPTEYKMDLTVRVSFKDMMGVLGRYLDKEGTIIMFAHRTDTLYYGRGSWWNTLVHELGHHYDIFLSGSGLLPFSSPFTDRVEGIYGSVPREGSWAWVMREDEKRGIGFRYASYYGEFTAEQRGLLHPLQNVEDFADSVKAMNLREGETLTVNHWDLGKREVDREMWIDLFPNRAELIRNLGLVFI